ncbi:hemerythrin domain-containing protein [Streptomyces sp. AM 2-1-1]|uniref:hemerythrin domain-containing protein n=1 Tax=Streptomyces sp. AM 2-1-1 TaxID=3028709 RepID=UPI0023B96FB3|nr:hemerythrin domain-containing protein [Streptomyces sp. AM 2-1-1]WEH41194.1 hemerythrin domain-containing protein [Streptomyces sp. AM 2-1-1]
MPTSLTAQSYEALGGDDSILVRQRRDHAELDRMMRSYESAGGSDEERRRTLKEIVQLTFSHAFAEETVLWPALRRLAPDGEELTARVEKEHQQINELIAGIERTAVGAPARHAVVARAFDLIRQDIRDEEDLLLPRLQEALDTAELRRLGAAWEAVRRTAPTHPHPAVPRRPPGNVVLGVPLSAYDRARDLVPLGADPARVRRLAAAAAVLALGVWLVRTVRAQGRRA